MRDCKLHVQSLLSNALWNHRDAARVCGGLYSENQVTQLSSESAEGAVAANRFLYYEFCHEGMVDGLLKQSYAQGWGQVSDRCQPLSPEYNASQ